EGLYRIQSDQAANDLRNVPLVGPRADVASLGDLANLRAELTGTMADLGDGLFIKADPNSPAFLATDNTLSVKAGTKVFVNGKLIAFNQDTPLANGPLSAIQRGKDFAIWVCDDGT